MQEFVNVILYTPGNVVWPNIVRIDVAKAKVWIAPYAQYQERVFVEFTRKGKRKVESLVTDYLVVLSAEDAIDPDDAFLPPVNGVAAARYGIADSRWRTDFEEKLKRADVPILGDFRLLRSGAAPLESSAEAEEASEEYSAPVENSPTALDGETAEFEEGVRHLAERSFFDRNPRLVEEAKRQYVCICQACGFDFVSAYGELGNNFAEVHHLNPLSERLPEERTQEIISSVADVAVLCANCHRMIHRRKPALSIDQLKATLREQNSK
ncbi:MAG: HNH endonuclease [Terracidiphilus sp.]